MYVRVKRKKTAIFLMVEPTDTASDLKIKIHHITKVATTDMKLYLDAKGEVQLDENKSLADQKARRRAAPARRASCAARRTRLAPPPPPRRRRRRRAAAPRCRTPRPHCAPRPPRPDAAPTSPRRLTTTRRCSWCTKRRAARASGRRSTLPPRRPQRLRAERLQVYTVVTPGSADAAPRARCCAAGRPCARAAREARG